MKMSNELSLPFLVVIFFIIILVAGMSSYFINYQECTFAKEMMEESNQMYNDIIKNYY